MPLNDNALASVAQIKTALRISFSDDDSYIEDLINQVSEKIELFLDRRIKDAADVTEYYNGVRGGKLILRKYPVNSITSVAYATGDFDDPTWNIISGTNQYQLDALKGILKVANMYTGSSNYRVIYRGGYTNATMPAAITEACVRMVSKRYGMRASEGATNESVGGASVGWQTGMDKEVAEILDRYVRISF